MSLASTQKVRFFKALRITGRDLRVFGLSAVLLSSLAIGAVSLAQPAHSQSASTLCSSGKFFR